MCRDSTAASYVKLPSFSSILEDRLWLEVLRDSEKSDSESSENDCMLICTSEILAALKNGHVSTAVREWEPELKFNMPELVVLYHQQVY
jgi:hypothetical protein